MSAKNKLIEFVSSTDRYSLSSQIKTIAVTGTSGVFSCKLVDSKGATICNINGLANTTVVIPIDMQDFVDAINIDTFTNVSSIQITIA